MKEKILKRRSCPRGPKGRQRSQQQYRCISVGVRRIGASWKGLARQPGLLSDIKQRHYFLFSKGV